MPFPEGSHSQINQNWERMTPHWKRHSNAFLRFARGRCGASSSCGPESFTPRPSAAWWAKRRVGQLLGGGGDELAGNSLWPRYAARRLGPLDRRWPAAPVRYKPRSTLTDLPMAATTRLPSAGARTPELLAKKLVAHISPNDSFKTARGGRPFRPLYERLMKAAGAYLARATAGSFPIGSRRHQKPHRSTPNSWGRQNWFDWLPKNTAAARRRCNLDGQ